MLRSITDLRRAGVQAAAGAVLALLCAIPAEAQSAAAMYERAQERYEGNPRLPGEASRIHRRIRHVARTVAR